MQKELEEEGIYCEFCDGNVVMFYLSPVTSKEDFDMLTKRLTALFEKYPYEEENQTKNDIQRISAPLVFDKNAKKEWAELSKSEGKICAANCGLFPPCTPLIKVGERVTADKIALLEQAANVYGLYNGKIQIFKDKKI